MKTGISTSSYYPLETLEALKSLGKAGVGSTELFFNSASELTDRYVDELKAVAKHYGVRVVSVHPFTSGFEPFLFFSNYPRRLEDGRRFYEQYFRAAQRLGAEICVLHGDHHGGRLSEEEYFERFALLSDDARRYGVTLAQENVARCRCREPGFVRRMSAALGEKAAFVLDLKQALRSGTDAYSMAQAMGNRLLHVHVSDSGPAGDCLAPGNGNFDFARFFQTTASLGYQGSWMIELYRENYPTERELLKSLALLSDTLEKAALQR
ncbi:MAG: sugar phosphate isomerase/epimerase [Oscillospiraceae bacterium]|nr:sugar phosphate isomerase/epimerase [Oscillospiraceae bacterium]